MLRYPVMASIVFLLTACANIEHRTPEARQQITHDLELTGITDTALTSFCWLQIGGPAYCKNTPGISVLTPDSLLLVSYENGVYVQKDILRTEDVNCISDGDGQNFYVFKDQLAVSLIPYTEVDGAPAVNNPEYRAKAIRMLLRDGQPYLTGKEAGITQETGKKQYGVQTIYTPSGPLPIVVGTEGVRIVSPCPAGS